MFVGKFKGPSAHLHFGISKGTDVLFASLSLLMPLGEHDIVFTSQLSRSLLYCNFMKIFVYIKRNFRTNFGLIPVDLVKWVVLGDKFGIDLNISIYYKLLLIVNICTHIFIHSHNIEGKTFVLLDMRVKMHSIHHTSFGLY